MPLASLYLSARLLPQIGTAHACFEADNTVCYTTTAYAALVVVLAVHKGYTQAAFGSTAPTLLPPPTAALLQLPRAGSRSVVRARFDARHLYGTSYEAT
ncbi:hypothetical protein C8Q78DRAFT_1006241 [Trametes maxima]|nr:hypothetical protein C8Q78DRAFT_1006241 [Trametes maxima]